MLDAKTKALADEAATLIYDNAKRLEGSYGFLQNDSELFYINNRQKNSLNISDELVGLIKLSKFYFQKTSGIFDIAFAGTMRNCNRALSLEEYEEKMSSLLPYARLSNISIIGNKLQFSNNMTKLDLGGLVKEYAVDQSVLILKSLHVFSALVDFGGDISVIGNYKSSQWNIGIQDPNNNSINIKNVYLNEQSICTSGHSKNFYMIEDKRISHIISKEEHRYKQVSIIAPTAVDAGIWSTVLLIDATIKLPSHVILVCAI